ncbi:MAG: HAMP domain-containing sensor histidine kinase [Bdellovibrionota bacterium]
MSQVSNQILHHSKLAALGELSATVVHDIRGPLAVIQVTCEDLVEECTEKKTLDLPTLNQHIGQISKACERIKKLVDHLQNYARNDANEKEETKKLTAIIEDSFFMVEHKIRQLGIKTSMEIENSLMNAELICYPNKLEQALMNLLSNACDAMQNVSTKELTVKVKTEQGFLNIAVIDTGSGIPESIMPKIFESFFTTKPKNEGTGLGLSIVKGIVNEHGGDLLVESIVGKGTIFTIKLATFRLV